MEQFRIATMVLFVMVAVVSAGIDKKCYQSCISDCKGQGLALCINRCTRTCQDLSITNAQHICTLGCAKSKCTNFSSDGNVDKVKGCFNTCAEDCAKK